MATYTSTILNTWDEGSPPDNISGQVVTFGNTSGGGLSSGDRLEILKGQDIITFTNHILSYGDVTLERMDVAGLEFANGNPAPSQYVLAPNQSVSFRVASDITSTADTYIMVYGRYPPRISGDFFYLTVTNPDQSPNSFSFTDVTNADVGVVYQSNEITVSGITIPTPISNTYSSLYVNGVKVDNSGEFVNNGDKVKVHVRASYSYNTTLSATVTIGDKSDTYSVTTGGAPDTTPDAFNLGNNVTNASLNTVYKSSDYDSSGNSNGITITGINQPVTATLTITQGNSGTLYINGVSQGTSGTVNNGDEVKVHIRSSTSYNTTHSVSLNIGGVTDTWAVTTGSDNVPDQFNMGGNVTNAELDQYYDSASMTLSGFSTAVTATVTNGDLFVNNVNRGSSYSVSSGDVVRVRLRSSTTHDTTISTTLNIGGVTDTWSVTTESFTGSTTTHTITITATYEAEGGGLYILSLANAGSSGNRIQLRPYDSVVFANSPSSDGTVSITGVSTSIFNAGSAGVGVGGSITRTVRGDATKQNTQIGVTYGTQNKTAYFSIEDLFDSTPDQFDLGGNLTNVGINKSYDSKIAVIRGISIGTTASVNVGTLYINGVASGQSGTVNNGDEVYCRLTSSGSYSTTVTQTLTIGGVTDSWSVTTEPDIETRGVLIQSGQTTGNVVLTHIRNFLMGSEGENLLGRVTLSNLLKGGSYVPNISQNSLVPLVAPIALTNLRNVSSRLYFSSFPANIWDAREMSSGLQTYEWTFQLGNDWNMGYGIGMNNACEFRFEIIDAIKIPSSGISEPDNTIALTQGNSSWSVNNNICRVTATVNLNAEIRHQGKIRIHARNQIDTSPSIYTDVEYDIFVYDKSK